MYVCSHIYMGICVRIRMAWADKLANPATFPWRCDGQASRHSAGRWEVLDDDRATGVTSTATAVSQRVAPRPRGEHMPTLGKIQGIAAFETQAVPCTLRRWCC